MAERGKAEDFSLLTEVENAALTERKGLRKRAKALRSLSELATLVGMSPDVVEAMAEKIRSLDVEHVKRYNQTFDTARGYFAELPAEPGSNLDDDAALVQEVESPVAVETALELTSQLLDELVENAEPGSDELEAWPPQMSLREIKSFYTAINKKTAQEYLNPPQSQDQIDSDEILALLELYARHNSRSSAISRTLDKMLVGLELGAVQAAERLGSSPASLNTLRYSLSNKIAEHLDVLMSSPADVSSAPEALEIEAVVPVEIQEPSEKAPLQEMEPHELLNERYAELFQFDSAEIAAFRSLIDPTNRGEITANKERVIEAIRSRLETELGSLVGLREILPPAERIRVATLLGFHIKEKTIGDQPPRQLSQQLLTPSNAAERRAQIENLYKGLETVAEFFEAKHAERSNVLTADFEHHTTSVKKVTIVDGKAQLL